VAGNAHSYGEGPAQPEEQVKGSNKGQSKYSPRSSLCKGLLFAAGSVNRDGTSGSSAVSAASVIPPVEPNALRVPNAQTSQDQCWVFGSNRHCESLALRSSVRDSNLVVTRINLDRSIACSAIRPCAAPSTSIRHRRQLDPGAG